MPSRSPLARAPRGCPRYPLSANTGCRPRGAKSPCLGIHGDRLYRDPGLAAAGPPIVPNSAGLRSRSTPRLDWDVLLRVGPERAALPLRPVAVQDMMDDADYVRRESRDVPQHAAREHVRLVGVPVFVDASEVLSGDVLNVLGARTVDLDEARLHRMDREVVAPVPAVTAPVPDRVARLLSAYAATIASGGSATGHRHSARSAPVHPGSPSVGRGSVPRTPPRTSGSARARSSWTIGWAEFSHGSRRASASLLRSRLPFGARTGLCKQGRTRRMHPVSTAFASRPE